VTKIDKKIVGYSVVSKSEDSSKKEEPDVITPAVVKAEVMSENYNRPGSVNGTTYRIKTPMYDSALYITINDVILNQDTDAESIRPFEMFINSKEMSQFQWIVALTRIISAVFRKGGDVTFLVDELKSVFDPKGGYFKKGEYIPSLVAEIGGVLEKHLISRGLIVSEEMDASTKIYLEEKRKEVLARAEHAAVKVSEQHEKAANSDSSEEAESDVETDGSGFPDSAVLCDKCRVKAVVRLDNCMSCLNCGDSKCN